MGFTSDFPGLGDGNRKRKQDGYSRKGILGVIGIKTRHADNPSLFNRDCSLRSDCAIQNLEKGDLNDHQSKNMG